MKYAGNKNQCFCYSGIFWKMLKIQLYYQIIFPLVERQFHNHLLFWDAIVREVNIKRTREWRGERKEVTEYPCKCAPGPWQFMFSKTIARLELHLMAGEAIRLVSSAYPPCVFAARERERQRELSVKCRDRTKLSQANPK